MKDGRLGYRHYGLVVLLYCLFGLISNQVFAQCPVSVTECSGCPSQCDEGEAFAAAEKQVLRLQCTQSSSPDFQVGRTNGGGCGLLGGGQGDIFQAQYWHINNNAWGTQGTYRYVTTCLDRSPGASGSPVLPEGETFGCDTGCMFQEFGDTEVCMVENGIETCAGGYQQHFNGETCAAGEGGPLPPDPPPPTDEPCIETANGPACLQPPNFCVGTNCVPEPPPGGCAYGDPTVCVGNPPPPPTAPPPPEPPPGEEPCATGNASNGGNNYQINVHCLEEPPPVDPCIENPALPQCQEEPPPPGFCEENPEHVDCNSFCDMNPQHAHCDGEFCENNPDHFLCETGGNCEDDPEDPLCQPGGECDTVPPPSWCGPSPGTCATNPSDPVCSFCVLYPNDPVCQQSGNPCDEFPDHDACTGAQVGGGATCESMPACTGDVIGCATLIQQWRTRCAVEAITDGEEAPPVEGSAEDHFSETDIGVGTFNTAGFLGGGGCPSDTITLNFFGTSQSAPTLWCEILPWLGWLVVAAATVTGVRILGGD